MANRVKYPLTEEAKGAARHLVEAWSTGEIKQLTMLDERDGSVEVTQGFPEFRTLLELSEYHLISIRRESFTRWRASRDQVSWVVLLLQELRNAVENDFAVSDFFLTTAAVGTIITGNATITGGTIQGAASISGNIYQSAEQVSDALVETLGASLLEQNEALQTAVKQLRTASGPQEVKSKAGHVIEELGRCIVHVANTGAAIAALQLIAQFLR